MPFAKLSTKGQLIIPKAHRTWPPGTEFSVSRVGSGLHLVPVVAIEPVSIAQGFGVLAGKVSAVAKTAQSDDAEMLEAVRTADDKTKSAPRIARRKK